MKPKYRYNWKTGEWEKLYRFVHNVSIVTGMNLDGSYQTITAPYGSPLVDLYSKLHKK